MDYRVKPYIRGIMFGIALVRECTWNENWIPGIFFRIQLSRACSLFPIFSHMDTDFPISCTGDAVTGDAIRFEEAIFEGSFRNPKFR